MIAAGDPLRPWIDPGAALRQGKAVEQSSPLLRIISDAGVWGACGCGVF